MLPYPSWESPKGDTGRIKSIRNHLSSLMPVKYYHADNERKFPKHKFMSVAIE